MPSVDDAFPASENLDTQGKLELISRIWESIRSTGDFRPSDSDLAKINRRWAEYEAGTLKAIPWEQVRDEIRQKLSKQKTNG